MEQEYLQDWVFHYNVFTQKWAAIPRELYQQYWSDYNIEGVIRSSSLETLLSILHITKGDEGQIQLLLTNSTE